MKKHVKDKLVAALRSGEYEQGMSRLVTILPDGSEHFCCLGVLCNIATENGFGEWGEMEVVREHAPVARTIIRGVFNDEDGIEKAAMMLPYGVMKWAGMKTRTGETQRGSLVDLNDSGVPHSKIADFIEKNYREL